MGSMNVHAEFLTCEVTKRWCHVRL